MSKLAGSWKAIIALVMTTASAALSANANSIKEWVASAALGLITAAAVWLKANAPT